MRRPQTHVPPRRGVRISPGDCSILDANLPGVAGARSAFMRPTCPARYRGLGLAGGPVLGRIPYARKRFDSPTHNCRCSWHGTLKDASKRYREFVNRAVREMKTYLAEPTEERQERLWSLLQEIEAEQNEYENIRWGGGAQRQELRPSGRRARPEGPPPTPGGVVLALPCSARLHWKDRRAGAQLGPERRGYRWVLAEVFR